MLDGDNLVGVRDQPSGQRAQPGSNLDHYLVAARRRRRDNTLLHTRID